jgi:RNA polymerase sigma-70 factor (ECF subfamily)
MAQETPPADDVLLRSFLDGDASSIAQIDRWIAEVLRHPALHLGADIDDVAQQVRRKLLVSLRAGRFQGTATLRTYVWRAAQHAAIDHLRLRHRRAPSASLDDIAEPPDPAQSPEQALLQAERREIFAAVLARLGDDCRELFQRIAFDELSYRDIAGRLGATEGAIKVRALRCREKAVAIFRSVTSGPDRRPLPKEPL